MLLSINFELIFWINLILIIIIYNYIGYICKSVTIIIIFKLFFFTYLSRFFFVIFRSKTSLFVCLYRKASHKHHISSNKYSTFLIIYVINTCYEKQSTGRRFKFYSEDISQACTERTSSYSKVFLPTDGTVYSLN
jgi:hypothetical protein